MKLDPISEQMRLGYNEVRGPRRTISIIEWLQSFFRWEFCDDAGIWRYEENKITGQRRARKLARLFGPINREWLGRHPA